MLNYVIEQELVMKNLLSKFLPLISYVAGNTEGKFSRTPLLRATAVLALCRYMSISVSVCESLLPLLFTVLEREMGDPSSTTTTSTTTTSTTTTTPSGTVEQQDTPQQQQIRTTIMIALGDLAFRFPNSVEPWTNRMYSRYVCYLTVRTILTGLICSFSLTINLVLVLPPCIHALRYDSNSPWKLLPAFSRQYA